MKIEKKPEFSPISLVLETQDEVDKLFAVFNHNQLRKGLEIVDNPLYGLETDRYMHFHHNLCKIVQ